MTWYSECLTPLARWAPQLTPDRPRERLSDGCRVTLRRVQELPAWAVGKPLAEIQREMAAREAHAARLAEEARAEADGWRTEYPEEQHG